MANSEQDTLIREDSNHPSRSLKARTKGYGIGGGYEKPRAPRNEEDQTMASASGDYGAVCHGGYYGSGGANRPFKVGNATFEDEIDWYKTQYGERTSGQRE